MFLRSDITRAVDLQARAYMLLVWLEKAIADRLIAPEAAKVYGTERHSAEAWIRKHRLSLPETARPAVEDVCTFSQLFSTYLLNTFAIDAEPGQRLYSPDAHCFCPLCSWMVNAAHIVPVKPSSADKVRAERMKRGYLRSLAAAAERPLSDEACDALLADPVLREPIGLATYGADLLTRLEGVTVGAASLVLWRSFAWTREGSPKKKFVLTVDAILAAESLLLERVKTAPDAPPSP